LSCLLSSRLGSKQFAPELHHICCGMLLLPLGFFVSIAACTVVFHVADITSLPATAEGH